MERKGRAAAGVLAGLLAGCGTGEVSVESERCYDSSECAPVDRCIIELEGDLQVSGEGNFLMTDVGTYQLDYKDGKLNSGPVSVRGILTSFPSNFSDRQHIYWIVTNDEGVHYLANEMFKENERQGYCEGF